MKYYAAVVMVLCCLNPVSGSTDRVELTLTKALQLALEHNHNFQISKEEIRRYQYKVKQALGFLPTVTLEGTRNLDEKLMKLELPSPLPGAPPQETTLDFTRNYEFTFQLVQPVFTGGKVLYSFKNAKLDVAIAKEKKTDTLNWLKLTVKKIFYNVLVMREVLKSHEEVLKLAQDNFSIIDEKFKLGMVSKYDRLRAELAVSTIKPEILQTRKLLEISLLNLKTITGIKPERPLLLKGKLEYSSDHINEPRLIAAALAHAPQLSQLKLQQGKTGNLLKMAYGQFLPQVSLVAAYTYRSDVFKFGKERWDNFYTINLALRLPIFSRLKRSAEIGEIKVMRKILDLNKQQVKDALVLQVNELCLTLRREHESIRTGFKNIRTAKEGVRIAQLTYKEGLITLLELNTSISQLTRARLDYLQAVYNANIAVAEMEKLTGLQLKKNGKKREGVIK